MVRYDRKIHVTTRLVGSNSSRNLTLLNAPVQCMGVCCLTRAFPLVGVRQIITDKRIGRCGVQRCTERVNRHGKQQLSGELIHCNHEITSYFGAVIAEWSAVCCVCICATLPIRSVPDLSTYRCTVTRRPDFRLFGIIEKFIGGGV